MAMETAVAGAAQGLVKGTIEAPFDAVEKIAKIADQAVETYIKWQQEKREGQKFNMEMNEKFGTVKNQLPDGMSNLPGTQNYPKLSLFSKAFDCPPPFKNEKSVCVSTAYFYHTKVKAVRSIGSLIQKGGPYSTSKREDLYAAQIAAASQPGGAALDPKLMKGLTNLAVYQPLEFHFTRVRLDVDTFEETRDNIKAAIEADRTEAKQVWRLQKNAFHNEIQDRANKAVDDYFKRLANLTTNVIGGWSSMDPLALDAFLKKHENLLGKDYAEMMMKVANEHAKEEYGRVMKSEVDQRIRALASPRIRFAGTSYQPKLKDLQAWVDGSDDLWGSLPPELNQKFDVALRSVDRWYNDIVHRYTNKRFIANLKIKTSGSHLGRERKCTETARHELEGDVTAQGSVDNPRLRISLQFSVYARKGKEASTVARQADFSLYPDGKIDNADSSPLGSRIKKFAVVE